MRHMIPIYLFQKWPCYLKLREPFQHNFIIKFRAKDKCFFSKQFYPLQVTVIDGELVLSLQWRHNERDGVSSHQSHDCLLVYRLIKAQIKETSKLRVTGHCDGNSPVTGEFPAQRASNAENVSICWRHHDWLCSNWHPVTFNLKSLLKAR